MRAGATITVGYDGSVCARRALEWAAGAADHRPVTVRAIACYGPPPTLEPWMGQEAPEFTAVRDDALRMLDQAVAVVELAHPTIQFERAAMFGRPVEVLVDEAAGSDLLVVGTRGQRGLDAWRVGSVVHGIVRHARCPVVVVPPGASEPRHDRLVVGVDGSPASMAALRWACDEADDRDAVLVVVHVWDYVYATELGSPTARDLTQVDASLQLEAAVRAARERRCGPVEAVLTEGSTSTELVARAAEADLLVVGSRGRSAVRETLFGSVSQTVAAHATCPTVIVRERRSQ